MWHQPGGGREVIRVAMPLVVSSLSWTVMTFVDRVLLKWQSGAAMTAAFSSAMIWFVLLCLPLGICAYANTFVSQYHGDRQHDRIGLSVWQAVWVALVVTPCLLAVSPWAPQLFQLVGHAPEIRQEEIRYLQALNWGAGGMLVGQAAAAFYSGRGNTIVVMWVDALFAALNVLLDYLWIFGHAGFPAGGTAGAGYATSVALWLKAITYILLMLQPHHRIQYGTWMGCRFDAELFRRLLHYGIPSGLQMLLDVAGFTTFVTLVGRLGSVEAEATSMAFSISTLAFMPIWGVGMAASILVGQHLGENNDHLAARATWTALAVGMCYMAVISALYVLAPQLFLWWFFAGSDQPGGLHSHVAVLARTLLRFVAAYNLFDALLTVLVNAIKGAGDTQFVLLVSLIMGSFIALFSWLAVEVWHLQIYGCWVVMVLWVWGLGITYLLRFMQGKWRTMRVIEMVHEAPDVRT